METRFITALIGTGLALSAVIAHATPITCGDPSVREATLSPAQSCRTAVDVGDTGNPNANDIRDAYAGGAWTALGDITVDSFNAGAFGRNNVDLDWSIDPGHWADFGQIVVSIHVGNGGGDPDWFAWLLETHATTGNLVYDRISGGGGGFSNIKAWGRGERTRRAPVSEPTTLALLSLGLLIGVCRARRRRAV